MKSHFNISELKEYFDTAKLPASLRLDSGTYIPNLAKTVAVELKLCAIKEGIRGYLPYYDRLCRIREKVENIDLYELSGLSEVME